MTNRQFAYNPTMSPISGTIQVGELAVGNSSIDYSSKPGGITWWMGPDETSGYVISTTYSSGTFPTPLGNIGDVQFWRSDSKTEPSFLSLVQVVTGQTFLTGSEARTWLLNNGYWTSYSVYTIDSGTKTPVLGSSGQNPFPASGWTQLISASGDDASLQLNLPFSITFNGTSYSRFFPNSNFYITFGSGTSQYNGLTASSPNLNKIYFAGKDNSWQRVSSFASDDKYLRLRWEGNGTTSGTPGSPGIVYELTVFNPIYTNGENWIELLVGTNVAAGQGISGIYGPNSQLTGGQIVPGNAGVAASQSYVFSGDSTGTSWTVYTGYHIGGTDY